MAHERAGATVVLSGMAGFVIWCLWPRKPCTTCKPPSSCPTGDFPANAGLCPTGYQPDPAAPGCCMPVSILTSCPTCPAPTP